MRITAFRKMMAEEFGEIRADMLARDHVFSALNDRTVDQALEAGVSTKEIWQAVCEAFEVPPDRR
jgi:Protein of unknown function (DUF3046)